MQLLIDVDFAERVVPANDSVDFANQIVEELNLIPLYRAYKRRGRKPAPNPSTMLKVVLYAEVESKYSSHNIEAACSRDINYVWLLNGEAPPKRTQIDSFREVYSATC